MKAVFLIDEKRFPREMLKYYIKRIIYVFAFAALCLIDQVIGSATGYIQYGLKNYTIVIIAVMILTSYELKSFLKIPYLIWMGIFFICRYFVLKWGATESSNFLELQANLWCVGIYGVLLLRWIYYFFIEKRKPHVKWLVFGFSFLMLLGMTFIRNDWTWPCLVFVSMTCFFLTDFKEKDLNNLYSGMVEGIILGTIIIQIMGWMYRPYDTMRYQGMYSHANMNALLYVCAYCATLGKWYLIKLQKRNVFFQIITILLAGLIISMMLFTGSRSALVTSIVVTFVFLVFQMISCRKSKIREFIKNSFAIITAIVLCFFPAYCMIRYIPAIIDNPIYFESDEIENKVQKGEPIDSEKYYEIDEAIEGNVIRYLWFLDEEETENYESRSINWLTRFFTPMKVLAREVVDGYLWYATDEVYVEPGTDRNHPLLKVDREYSPIEVRLTMYEYYIYKLTFIGSQDNVQGVWLHHGYQATHCHNIFLQMAYDFGIIVGVMFIIVTIMLFNRIIFGLSENKSPMWYYRLFITAGFATIEVVFGMTEMAYIYGQLPLTMFWLVQYIVYHKQPHEIEADQVSGDGEELLLTTPSGVVIEDGLEIIDMDEE